MSKILNIVRQPHEISFSRNPVTFRFKISPYGDAEAAINTAIPVSLYAESEHYKNDFREIKKVVLRPDTEGFAFVNFQTLLDGLLEFYVPDSSNKIQVCSKQAVRYYIRYALINDYEQVQAPEDTDKLSVMKGGLSYESWTPRDFFDQKIISGKEYLRFSEDAEVVRPDEPLYFYVVDPNGYDPFSGGGLLAYLSLKLVPSAGTPSINISTLAGEGGGKWQIYCIPAGFEQNNLGALVTTGNLADSLYIEVFNGVTRVGKLYGMSLDYRNYYDTRTLHYHNSLGGFDTQRMNGQISIGGQYDKTNVVRLDTTAYSSGRILKALNEYSDATETAQLKGETGWISAARAERLRDLLTSTTAYELTATRLKPVLITTKTATLYANNDMLYSLGLDWEDAYPDRNFSPDGYLTASTTCPDVDYFAMDQQLSLRLRFIWQLPDGYKNIEIRIATTATLPAVITGQQFFFAQNSGTVDVPVPFSIGSTGTVPVYAWARAVCDAATSSFGAWTAVGPLAMSKYVAPKCANVFVNTFKGAGGRLLSMLTLDQYITLQNTGSSTSTLSIPTSTTRGGTISVGSSYDLSYTPPSANFAGVDILTWQAAQTFPSPPGTISPYGTGKVYITVGNANDISGSPTGLPYVKLVQWGGGTITFNGNWHNDTTHLTLFFFRDPLGTIPLDVTPYFLSVTLVITSSKNGGTPVSYPNQTFSVVGERVELKNQNVYIDVFDMFPSFRQVEGDFTYTLLASPNYNVI